VLTTVEKVLFLLRAPVTADAPTDALARLATVANEHELAMGARLFAVGDAIDAIYIVLDGAVRVEGIESPSRLLAAGDVVAGLEAFGDGVHAETATAVVSTRLLRVERAELFDLLDEDGELARALFSGLVRAYRTGIVSATAP